MKILLIHNRYKIAGGEDSVFNNESDLLEKYGHDVHLFTVTNYEINSALTKIFTLINLLFSFSQYRKLKKILRKIRPDVVHVHNYFPLLSPSIFYACKSLNIAVVHTLHNYRSVCPTALLMHNGKINEKSVLGESWWTVNKKVYRNSYIGSFALACMVEFHKKIGTWKTKVDRFIALTEFSKDKYVEAGWPSSKIKVKPNFIQDYFKASKETSKKSGYALYIGRLSEEKGINTLLTAWNMVSFPLKVVGDGPLSYLFTEYGDGNVCYLGHKVKEDVLSLIKNANFIVMPSTWYETFGMVIIEAFMCGTPVIVSRLG